MAIETCSPSKVHPFVSHSAAGTTVVRRRVVGPQRQSEALSLHAAGPEGLPVTCAASSSVALSAPSFELSKPLLHSLAEAGRAVSQGSPEGELAQVLAQLLSCCIEADEGLLSEPGSAKADSMRQWLAELQAFVLALQQDVRSHKQRHGITADPSQVPLNSEEEDWQLLMQSVAAKLVPIIPQAEQRTASQPGSSAASSCGLDVNETSCNSSICGATSSSSSMRSGPARRMPAFKSCLSYKTHWAGKIAI